MYKEPKIEEKLKLMDLEELREYAENEVHKRWLAEHLLENVFATADKQSMALTKFIEKYDFNEKPNPHEALAHMKGEAKDILSSKSCKWFLDYDYIIWLVNVAYDYGFQIQTIEQEYKRLQEADV